MNFPSENESSKFLLIKSEAKRMGNTKEEEEEDKRREAAIASSPSLQSGLTHKRVSQAQLSKLQELHKRRLQLKTKIHKKSKEKPGKFHGNDYKNGGDKHSDEQMKHLNLQVESCNESNSLSGEQDDVAGNHEPKKRHKLHWGLDTKERWERKSNM